MKTRRELLRTAAAAAPSVLLAKQASALAARRGHGSPKGKNVLIFLSDQERAIQHFPRGWARENLPGFTQLQRNGLTFNNAFTNACMCSPARSTWMSGYHPAQHEVFYTLEQDMPASQYPQNELSTDLKNLASVMEASGYTPVYKGKWHCSKPPGSEAEPSDLTPYGFARWNPPDAGANQDPPEAGGGIANNDGRYMDSVGNAADGDEGVLQYLESQAAKDQPFFLIVSVVNPHDVLFYPRNLVAGGYDDSWLAGNIGLPSTAAEDLSTKPTVQEQIKRILALTGVIGTPERMRDYLNFYGNLMKSSDAYLVQVLNALSRNDLLDDTLIIRTADHGEMGMTHGGLRQKNFNMYEETMRIPLIYSNPKLWPRAESTNALVSHVDFLPTLASLFGAPSGARAGWTGVDYSPLVLNPAAKPVQEEIVFTYDDFQSGQSSGPYPKPPNHVVSIREVRWKFAEYYDVDGKEPSQFEMYDIEADPSEIRNLAFSGYKRTPEQQRHYLRLRRKLAKLRATVLKPLDGRYEVVSTKATRTAVVSVIEVPAAGVVRQSVALYYGDEGASSQVVPDEAGRVTVSTELPASIQDAREDGAVPVKVSTRYFTTGGFAVETTDEIVLPRLDPAPFTGR